MIKLERLDKPSYLSDEKFIELTNNFITNGDSVWNNSEIKKVLMLSSNGKCAYCECSISEESKYMEVEHFRHKKAHPNLVVEWTNLLPSCKRCNGKKGMHDVDIEPIINPYDDDPKDHLKAFHYRFKPKTEKGYNSIEALCLNDTHRLVMARFDIGERVQNLVSSAKERFENYLLNPTTINKNKLNTLISNLLTECQKDADYAAYTATLLLNDDSFNELIEQMKKGSTWDFTNEVLLQEAKSIKLDVL